MDSWALANKLESDPYFLCEHTDNRPVDCQQDAEGLLLEPTYCRNLNLRGKFANGSLVGSYTSIEFCLHFVNSLQNCGLLPLNGGEPLLELTLKLGDSLLDSRELSLDRERCATNG